MKDASLQLKCIIFRSPVIVSCMLSCIEMFYLFDRKVWQLQNKNTTSGLAELCW